MTEIIYGIRRTDGKIISIKEIPDNMRGLSCNCVCSNCGKELQACSLHGQVRPYFRHNNDSKTGESIKCNPDIANETALHQLAKQIIKEEQKILVPQKEISLVEAGMNNTRKEIENKISPFVIQKCRTINAQYIELEKNLENFTPDVFIKTEHGELLVEIFVSHQVDAEKRIKLKKHGSATLEIDLSQFVKKAVSSDELRDVILNSEKYKSWVYYPLSQMALDKAKRYYESKIKENKNTIPKRNTKNTRKVIPTSQHRMRMGVENYPFYLEIKDLFNDENNEKIIDSRGKRWLKCDYCGDKLLYIAFGKFNVDGNPNLGICLLCCHKYGLFPLK